MILQRVSIKRVLFVCMTQLSCLMYGSQKFLKIDKKQFSQEDNELFNFFSIAPDETYPFVYADRFLRKLEECKKNTQEFNQVKEKCKKVLTVIVPFWEDKYYLGASYKSQFMCSFLCTTWCNAEQQVSLVDFLPSLLHNNRDNEVAFSDVARDPCVINELLYIYKLKIRWDDLIVSNITRQGFILNNSFYEGKGSMPRACYVPQTTKAVIEYLKTMLKPSTLSQEILLQQKALLLCFKRLQKNSGIKIPRFVWLHHIFLPSLPDTTFEHIRTLSEIPYNQRNKSPEEQWLLYELPVWYKEELKKLASKKN